MALRHALVVLLVGAAAACQSDSVEAQEDRASVVMEAGPRDLALSPDGSRAALRTDDFPEGAFALLDVGSSTAKLLVLPGGPGNELSDFTFSADGETLAFVSNNRSRNRHLLRMGGSQIWILGAADQSVQGIISSGEDGFRYPAFSPDGRRLAYFKRVDPPGKDPIFQAGQDIFSIFERELSTGNEVRLTDALFEMPCGLTYSTEDSWYYCMRNPRFSPVREGPAASWSSVGPDGAAAINYRNSTDGIMSFRLDRGIPVETWPKPYPPIGSVPRQSDLAGSATDGSVILVGSFDPDNNLYNDRSLYFGREPDPVDYAFFTFDGAAVKNLVPVRWPAAEISADLRAVLSVEAKELPDSRPRDRHYENGDIIVRVDGVETLRMPVDELLSGATRIDIVPVSDAALP